MRLSRRPRPSADKIEVKMTAERLMQMNGQTTTLEVKNELRRRGYLAFQRNISQQMATIANESGWDTFYNGRNRIYALFSLQQRVRTVGQKMKTSGFSFQRPSLN